MTQERLSLLYKLSFAIAIIASIIFIYYPITLMHVEALTNQNIINPNTRNILPFHRLSIPEIIANDYITHYLDKKIEPFGYTLITQAVFEVTGVFLGNKLLGFFLLYSTIIPVAIVAWRLGGAVIAWSATTLVYAFPHISLTIMSTIPHMFGFPLIGWFFMAMVLGRVYLMAIITILGAFLYLPASMITGAVMAGYLLIMPASARGTAKNWFFIKRFLLLSFCGLIVLGNIFYSLKPIDGYGEYIEPYMNAENYPETGEDGVLYMGYPNPATNPILVAYLRYINNFKNDGTAITLIFFVASIFGLRKKIYLKYAFNDNSEVHWYRFVTYIISVLFLGLLLFVFAHFYAHRFFVYGLYLFSLIVIPLMIFVAVKDFCSRHNLGYKKLPLLLTMIVTLIVSFSVDSKNSLKYGYYKTPASSNELYKFAEYTPKETLFASMPAFYIEDLGAFDYFPYFAKRPVLLTSGVHDVFYKDYLLEMRARMNTIIDAVYSTNLEYVKVLRDKYKVDYFIVDKKWYEEKPRYFAPFDERIANAFIKAQEAKPFFLNNIDKAVMKSGDIYVFDLKKLVGG